MTTILLTPTMMLNRLEREAVDSASVRETIEVIVSHYGCEVGQRIGGLLVTLPMNRAGVLRKIGTLIHASPVIDKRA